jgi:hypothetical protein
MRSPDCPAAYYVNLDRRPDRRATFEACCQRAGISVERFPAIDGREIDLPPTRDPGDRAVHASLLSHKALLERARDLDLPAVMVFEDDAVFPEWFRSEVEHFLSLIPSDWGLVYFGGHGWPRRWEHVRGPVLRCTNIQNIECYVVRRRVIDQVIDALDGARPVAHRWADEVLRDLQGDIPTYTMLNPIVRQAVDFSDNYGRRGNDYHSRCDIPGWFTDREGEEYARQVRRFECPVVAELGVYKGRSCSFVAELIHRRGGTLFGIDQWDCEPKLWTDFEWWMNASGLRRFVNALRADSALAAGFFADDRFDVVFIDTEQSYAAVRREIDAWLPKLRRGGVLMGHDYANVHTALPDIRRAVDDVFGDDVHVVDSVWMHTVA